MRLFLALLVALPVAAAPPGNACSVVPPIPVPPESIGLKPGPVAALLKEAKDAGTSGFAVFKDGKFIAGFGEDKPYYLYSVTKSVTSIAAGRLFTEGKWTSVDVPISSLLPEFASAPAGAVTLRQWMSHTSGIRDARDANGKVLKEWNDATDWVKAALARPVQDPAGAVYRYNNLGPTLIAAAVERTTGERMDTFLRRTVFDPLCIARNTTWSTDRAGHAAGYTGLSISAFDLAKLGQ